MEIDRDQGLLDPSGLGRGITGSSGFYEEQARLSFASCTCPVLPCSSSEVLGTWHRCSGLPGFAGTQGTPYPAWPFMIVPQRAGSQLFHLPSILRPHTDHPFMHSLPLHHQTSQVSRRLPLASNSLLHNLKSLLSLHRAAATFPAHLTRGHESSGRSGTGNPWGAIDYASSYPLDQAH